MRTLGARNRIRRTAMTVVGMLIVGAGNIAAADAASADPAPPQRDRPSGSSTKPAPVRPADAWSPGQAPRVTPKPHRAARDAVAPLAAWSVTIGATSTNLLPTQWSTITATANQDVGPTPYYIVIRGVPWGGSPAIVAVCGSGTTCSASVTRPDPGQTTYTAYIASYPDGTTVNNVQAQGPNGGYNIVWRGIGIGLASNVSTTTIGGAVQVTATVGEDVGPTPFHIQIYDTATGERLAVCGIGTSCSAVVSQNVALTRGYTSVVGSNSWEYPPTGVISWSAGTWVTWTASPIRISLSAPGRTTNSFVPITAYSSHDLTPTPYYILIFNQATRALAASCGYGYSCTVNVPVASGWNSFVAFLAPYSTTFEPGGTEASSNSVHVDRQRLA